MSARREKTAVPLIGIVGGLGPYAGLDLVRKLLDNTLAEADQDHLPVALLSAPSLVEDRTRFLLGESEANPGLDIAELVLRLERVGAQVIGIPCNTAHAPLIFEAMSERLVEAGSSIRVLHMIEEVATHVASRSLRRVGLVATKGTVISGVYPEVLGKRSIEVEGLAPDLQDRVQSAIYDATYGIKAKATPVTERARAEVLAAVDSLIAREVEAVILGCTELPLAVPDAERSGIPLIDPATILARALIRAVAPEKLRP